MAIPLIMQAMKGSGRIGDPNNPGYNPQISKIPGPGRDGGTGLSTLTPDERARFEAEQRAQAASDPNQVELGLAGGNPSTKTEMEKARG